MASTAKQTDRLLTQIREQVLLMQQCGWDRAGYIRTFGDPTQDEVVYGEGGDAMYDADLDVLNTLQFELDKQNRRDER
ncbi:MAG: hypothetical protein GY809_31935 [Planctomycetes bacterium]|nr:hypothetical protein [Planctomycetota bacterium]